MEAEIEVIAPDRTVERNATRIVVQHNALAEARYKLSLRAQKLLIRLIAELDQHQEDFTEIKLSLRDFAAFAAQEANDVTFAHFVEAAEQFLGRFVAVSQAPVPGEALARELVCHWISSIEKNPNDKSITFSFDKKLKPYLLGLKRSFFSYREVCALNLSSTYSIRLYQWAKAREYLRRPQTVTVDELRLALGTIEYDGRGRILKDSLRRYADFNRVALKPAIAEINKKSDIFLSFREVKKPGTKIVCAVVFTIGRNEKRVPAGFEPPEDPQFELSLEDDGSTEGPADSAALLEKVRTSYQLSEAQVSKVAGYIAARGIDYVREKITLTESQPRENAGRFFMAALRDDFKLPVRYKPEPKRLRARSPEPVALEQSPASDAELATVLEKFRTFRRSFAAS
jgi:plasmid replication initiation protein